MKHGSGLQFCSILVDFENLFFSLKNYRPDLSPGGELVHLLDKLRYKIQEEYGYLPILNRTYADYQKDYEMADVQGDLQLAGFEPQFIHSKPSKNSADILLSIDAMEMIVLREDIRCLVICAGDSDYLPIIRRILQYGKQVLLCAFSFNMSGDLKRQVGEHNIIRLNSLLPKNRLLNTGLGYLEEEIDFGPEEMWEFEIDEEEEKLLRVIVQEHARHEREVWVGPFFRDIVPNEADLGHLSRFEIQNLIDRLKGKGVIRVRKVPGKPHPYSVFIINFAHPSVRDLVCVA
ncbi:NYN domain-containing protein [Sulfidibacter corallicola]|uniref:NYN domain-containing protein n=1 Tax=Sulfidibacter corallicola TaxID=2818388 RepID=A0A8A4TIR0_SULCO|nr:NYN domain-containing protein [Sulfidibacter corallicola]QTD49919.1 NYN domain-containing protein [Sulfidibacter corallicola]